MVATFQGGMHSTVTGTMSFVSASTSTQLALSANGYRSCASFFNQSGGSCYLAMGVTASLAAFSVKLQEQSYYELPPARMYTGPVSVIWPGSTSGSLQITEYM